MGGHTHKIIQIYRKVGKLPNSTFYMNLAAGKGHIPTLEWGESIGWTFERFSKNNDIRVKHSMRKLKKLPLLPNIIGLYIAELNGHKSTVEWISQISFRFKSKRLKLRIPLTEWNDPNKFFMITTRIKYKHPVNIKNEMNKFKCPDSLLTHLNYNKYKSALKTIKKLVRVGGKMSKKKLEKIVNKIKYEYRLTFHLGNNEMCQLYKQQIFVELMTISNILMERYTKRFHIIKYKHKNYIDRLTKLPQNIFQKIILFI
ncbi:MAG: hypothetical protein JKX76_01450 [Colwellia sp.]|nr:hypothetical protein [Colwellia sp.]